MITEYKNTETQLITQEEIKINVTGFDKREHFACLLKFHFDSAITYSLCWYTTLRADVMLVAI